MICDAFEQCKVISFTTDPYSLDINTGRLKKILPVKLRAPLERVFCFIYCEAIERCRKILLT